MFFPYCGIEHFFAFSFLVVQPWKACATTQLSVVKNRILNNYIFLGAFVRHSVCHKGVFFNITCDSWQYVGLSWFTGEHKSYTLIF